MTGATVTFDEGQRQMVLLALAELSIARPGWAWCLNQIALKMDNSVNDGQAQMFETFRQLHTLPLRAKLLGEIPEE